MTMQPESRPSSRSPSPSGAGADGPTMETALTVEVDGRHYARQAGGFAPVAAPDVRHVCVVGGDDRECEGEATGCPCGCEASLPPWVRALLAEQRELIGRLTAERDAARLVAAGLERVVSRLSGEVERLTRELATAEADVETEVRHRRYAERRMVELSEAVTKAEFNRDEARGAADRMRQEREMVAADVAFYSAADGPDRPRFMVLTNDVFAFATADCEDVPEAEFARLYDAWKQHGEAGALAWAIEHRGEEPFKPFKEPFQSKLVAARAYVRGASRSAGAGTTGETNG
jgi:hypothetical protein